MVALSISGEDPLAPDILARLRAPGVARALASKGTWIYLGVDGAGVSIVDAADPSRPRLAGRIHVPGVATALAVAGSRLFVAIAPNSRVRIYDISNPGAPTLSGEIDTAAPVEALKQIGTQLHVAETNWAKLLLCLLGRFCPKGQTVEVFDVVDPSAAVLLGSYDGDMSPVVHQRTYRDYGYVRDRDGLRRFHFVPLQ